MTATPMDPNGPRPGALQAMLARLRGMADAMMAKAHEAATLEGVDAAPSLPHPPLAPARGRGRGEGGTGENPGDGSKSGPGLGAASLQSATPNATLGRANVPLAQPVDVLAGEAQAPLAEPVGVSLKEVQANGPAPEPQASGAPAQVGELCPHCRAPRTGAQAYCDTCGWIFPPPAEPRIVPPSTEPAQPLMTRLLGRYQLCELVHERCGVARYRGLDFESGTTVPAPVYILRAPAPPPPSPSPLPAGGRGQGEEGEAASVDRLEPSSDVNLGEAEILPGYEDPFGDQPATEIVKGAPAWPGIAWEREILQKARHSALPQALDSFEADNFEYLVVEASIGQPLWDAWDDEGATAEKRCGWLIELAEALDRLHQAGAILEGLRPDIVVVAATGQARLVDISDLLPLPLPPNPPVRATLYTAPELVLASDRVDARADLYSFGAMLYALHVGRELVEMDFDREGVPKPFIPRFPDIHPAFGRLITKTFCRDVNGRFPTDESAREDPSGFRDLIRTLGVCRRTLDNARLEIAAWTTTGMVRTGNEDAFALLHGAESRQDDMGECALVLVADGMGGYEAGEVAAAMAIQAARQYLLAQKEFAFLAGEAGDPEDGAAVNGAGGASVDVSRCQELIAAAVREANRRVYSAARGGPGRRGMGCTAEVVFVNSRYLVVGHVGDSRTYHLHRGRLAQVTRDQTLVNRLLELGTLTPEEAANHPRRSELQQAIGGHPDVEPAICHAPLEPGDWVLVCSDGLSNHVTADELKQMLQSEATCAEMAARRLVNFANLKGAQDNATVVVIRAT